MSDVEENELAGAAPQATDAGRGPAASASAAEALFRRMADAAPVMVWLAGAGADCVWFNKPWLEYTGRTPDEESGDGWLSDVHPDDRERCASRLRGAARERSSFQLEFRLRRHDGEFRWFHGHGVPRFGAAGEFIGFITSCADVTATKLAEQRLRESEENLCALVRASSNVVWQAGPDGLSAETARFWENLTGQTCGESEGWGWLEAVHPAERASVRRAWEEALEEKRRLELEYRILNRHGEYHHFLVHGVPVLNRDGSFRLWVGTMTDISGRVRAEQALRGSEARLRALVASATEFAILTITGDGRIKSWSEGAERLFGYAADEIIGKPAALLFTAGDRDAGVPKQELTTALDHGHALDERWHVRKDGSMVFASGAVSPIRGSDPPEFVKIARDLTDRKQMEDALKDADRRKNEFLATLAHELRNPLAPIRSGLDLLKRAGYDRRLIARTLRVIERQTDQIVHLVDDLLDISRITQGKIRLKKERVELRSIARRAFDNIRASSRAKEHQLTLYLPDRAVHVDADVTRVEQVLFNILNNAVKYTNRGGRISLVLETNESEAVITVTDSGIGIPEDKIGEVFNIFSQAEEMTDEENGGLGIGLSVVRSLVEMHGGSVNAFSEGAGKGSVFVIRLPLAAGSPAQPDACGGRPVAEEKPEPPTEGKRVLVIDDNRDAVAMLQILLTMEGHEVHAAYDGEEAVREAEEFRPDICLCDLGLPKMDGFEVARRISVTVPEALLVSVSGWGQEEDRKRSEQAGFRHHLVKPVKIDQVMDLIG